MSGAFWLGAVPLCLLALAFLLVPLWRERRRAGMLPMSGPLAAAAVVPVALAMYLAVTTYDPDAAQSGISSQDLALLEQLASRLADNPDDVEGWKLLGRSYRALGDYQLARYAFEQAWSRTANPDDELKLSYAEALLISDPTTALGMAGDLIDGVLATTPMNQAGLWLGGIVALERNQPTLARDRFAALLSTNPPREIAEILEQQLAALGGNPGSPGTASTPTTATTGPVIDVAVSVADSISLDRFGPGARLFLLARSDDMPAPIAVKAIELASLPGRFTLSDADAMLAGRSLEQYPEVTVVARISASGVPNEQPGDVYAEAVIAPDAGALVELIIDQVVPQN